MKSFLRVLLLAALLAAFSPASTGQAQDTSFHPPQTEAEIALAHILHLDHADRYFSSFVFKAPERDKTRDKDYANLFTQALEKAWEAAYLSIPPEDDKGGRYVGAGFIGCGQESSGEYLYATVKSHANEAYIAITWPDEADNPVTSMISPFRMIREKGVWKLDGVKCPSYTGFNGDFNYTLTDQAQSTSFHTSQTKADDNLQATLTLIKQRYINQPEKLEKLNAAQKAWETFAQAELDFLYKDRDGSIIPMCASLTRQRLVWQRVEQLKEWMHSEEGEVCKDL